MKLDPFNVHYDISQNYQSPRSTRLLLPPIPNLLFRTKSRDLFLRRLKRKNGPLYHLLHLATNQALLRTTSPPQPASDKQTNITSPPISENNEITTMDTSAPPNIVTATKRKSSDDGRDTWEERDKLSRKLAAHIRNSNNRFEALEKRMDSLEAKLESLTSIVHNLSTHISGKFNQIDERLNHIDERFSQIIEKLDRLHGRVP
ncbi:hypothetical protein HPB50_010011 [Hyalomma asiaticum]|uniref:Uncharacterized protein n=1 Tax=Hyalomma asiaticum TaxID=266040 RepID=A0ACB7T7E4_HYAAI|nr:hypothetical protein HPB50_010011 [Hyalomma asiaticum]